ncbi:MAG TPA: multiheme c-type cytochrome, partial [Thermodesulfobacteriota bacterium]|nr:multiheme c-type cytochrome [Thermodesulfobacteriota bacterium]
WVPSLPIPGVEEGTVYTLGIIAVLLILFVMTYSLRKRLIRGMPGRLDNWLWAHIYLGLLALFIIALHAEFRFSWDYHTAGAILLALVIVTGIVGRYFYTRVPVSIAAEQEKVRSRVDDVTKSINDLLVGKSRPFQKIIGSELNTPSPLSPKPEYWDELRAKGEIVPEGEKEDFRKAVRLLEQRAKLEAQSISQLKYKPLFRGWLTAHLLVTAGLIVMIPLHVLDDSFRFFPPKASDFSHPEECRQCHQRQYDEWIGSMHAYGQVSPVFIAFNHAVRNMGTGAFCVRCHTPIGIEIGEEGTTPNEERAPISLMGVQCDMCHTVEKNYGIVSAKFPLSPGRTKYGPFGSGNDGDPKAVRNPFHKSKRGDFLKSSEFCGSCHDVIDARGLRIEEAFTEWKESEYAEKGITCQDCHMRSLPGKAGQKKVMGPAAVMFGVKLPDRPLSDHSFIGPDNHLIDSFPYPDKPEETARIQRIYLEKKNYLLQNCATVEIVAPDIVSPSSNFQVEVKVTNTGAGHGIPTGFTVERQVWIEIIVKDAKDRVLFVSGDLDGNKDLRNSHSHAVKVGDVPIDDFLVNFQSQFINVPRRGVEEEVLLPGLATKVVKHNIMPYQPKSEFYPIAVPSYAEGPLRVDVRLRYRNLPPYLLDFLGVSELKDRLVIVDMASASKVISLDSASSALID